MTRVALILAAITALLALAPDCQAAWPIDGVELPGYAPTAIAGDGHGGMLFAFTDTAHVFLGRLDGKGVSVPGYPMSVATPPSGMLITPNFSMVRDAEGGVVIAWSAIDGLRQGQLFLTRFHDLGGVSWTTPLQATPQRSVDAWWPAICAGDSGDVYVSWRDRPDSSHAMLTRLNRDGQAAVGWSLQGSDIARARSFSEVTLEPDGLGGAILGLRGEWSGDLTVRRFGPDAGEAWSWSTPVHDISWGSPRTAPDGTGGAFLSWLTADKTNLVALRLSADGLPAPGWPATGVPLKTFAPRWAPFGNLSVCSDNAGGMFVVWWEIIPDDLFVQHLRGDGTLAPGWPVGGIRVSGAPDHQENSFAISDGAGGVLIAWQDWRDRVAHDHVAPFVQRISAAGNPAPGWAGDGFSLSAASEAGYVQIADDGDGGAFVSWEGWIYRGKTRVQRVRGDGVFGPLLDQETRPFQLLTPFPVPFRKAISCDLLMVRGEETQVDVVDISGRRIRSLIPRQIFPGGSHRLHWDGKDGDGVEVRPGVYFLRVHTMGASPASGSARVVKVR